MLKNNYTCGIDIGTHTTKVVVVGFDKGKKEPVVLATGSSPTVGMRFGYIANVDAVADSIKKAVKQAENILGIKIHRAYVSIGGISLSSSISTGSVIISKADQEITNLDVVKVIANSEENLDVLNKKVIHTFPLSYKLDGKEIYARPEGLRGIKLEVRTLFVTCLKQNIEDLITAFTLAKIEIEEIIASPIITANILLGSKQKVAGCILMDIGAETVSTAVFENNVPISVAVFPIGSMDITKDIALGLKISLEEAESIKLGSVTGGDYSKKKVDEIVEARLIDIFELVGNQLKRLKRFELLPAGIIITGNGSYINNIEEIARRELKLPVKVGPIDSSFNNKFKVRDASWYTALGLALSVGEEYVNDASNSTVSGNIKEVKSFFKSIFSQLLP
ncbi:MAG TPA: cell division FtsA domain-containing protein [Candidatus Paceibacterota bacterium]|nr:cell division FtsA domain-containing protein [Candidatus Paceibacterota bacterium]